MNDGSATVLVVDDKRNMLSLMAKVLGGLAEIHRAESGGEALRILASHQIDVVLCDLMMPDMDGLDVLRGARKINPGIEFILMTAYGTVGSAVEALRLGAYDYLTKPFEPNAAYAVVERALGRARLREPSSGDGEACVDVPGLLGGAPAMRDAVAKLVKFAQSDATCLLLGETGTGKERFARALHALGTRRDGPFVAVNCAAIPAELLESELFGHAKGAFTGAERARAGLFEEASGGSIFLDEIGEMRPSVQAKLTRVLEERAVRRVGESRERKVDARIIAATHCDLERMVAEGSFREDLWYRLNVALLKIPPLRERKPDIMVLARHFLREYAGQISSRKFTGFSPECVQVLERNPWRGNVRQLRAAVERACVLADGPRIEVHDLPEELSRAEQQVEGIEELSQLSWADATKLGRERTAHAYLERVLADHDGNVVEAARHAGIERESFYRLLRKHGFDHERRRNLRISSSS